MRRRSTLFAVLAMLLALTVGLVPVAQAQQASEVYWPTNGWRTSSPEEQGMDSAQLIALLDSFGVSPHSLVVIRHGYVVLDASTPPFKSSQQHVLHDVTHSFISTLVGMAIDKGHIKGVEQSIWDFLDKDKTANMDANKAAITIADLLTHRPGIGPVVPSDVAALWALTAQDPPAFQVYLDMATNARPGTLWDGRAVSANPMVLSAILQKATGVTMLDFAKQNLFSPLGITDAHWTATPHGMTFGGSELYLSPLDIAKLGYLYLHNGQWEGKQAVSEAWVKAATSAVVAQPGGWDSFGYLWWIGQFLPTEHKGYAALAPSGQEIWVIPDLDLVVVLTGDLSLTSTGVGTSPGARTGTQVIFQDSLLPAVKSQTALPANPDALAKLQAKVKVLAKPEPTAVQPVPENRKSVVGRVYTLEDNPLQWKSFRLDLGAKEATLTLDAEGRQLKLPVGLDGLYRVSTVGFPTNPARPFIRLRGDAPLASKGNWSARWFSLEMSDLLGMESWSVRFKFSGENNNKVTIDASYPGVAVPPINGTAQ